MKPGQIFTLDTQSVQEVADFTNVALIDVQKKIANGDVFSVSKKDTGTGDVVSASRWVDGKPRKGRPRRFPRATVLRLLGEETPPTVEETVEATAEANDAELEAAAATLVTEEKAAAANTW